MFGEITVRFEDKSLLHFIDDFVGICGPTINTWHIHDAHAPAQIICVIAIECP